MRLAVWADTEPRARAAVYALGLNPAGVTIFGNRSTGRVRGQTFDVLLILPGVNRDRMDEVLPSTYLGTVVDLGT